MPKPVIVIGINANDPYCMEQRAKGYLTQADQIWGTENQLKWFEDLPIKKEVIKSPIIEKLKSLKSRQEDETVVLLAGGDPNFFGLGSSLYKILPPEEIIIIPQPSTLQLAFAKIRISWENAVFTSAHAREIKEIIGLAKRFPKLGILTDPKHTPTLLSERLLRAGISNGTVYVIENLGSSEERITKSSLSDITMKNFEPLNVMIIVQNEAWKSLPVPFVRNDDDYYHKEGMITKSDIRLIGLQRLKLSDADIIWDIGAGSGAMSLEMAEVAWRGTVYAIEKDEDQLECIYKNIERYGIENIQVVHGVAPKVLNDLPSPHAVFIGGSGGAILPILELIHKKAQERCRVVAHFVLLENLNQAFYWMREHQYHPMITHIQISHSQSIGNGTRLIPNNPVFIVNGEKN